MKELFALLRLGLGNSTVEEENLSYFIMMPEHQWSLLGDIAMKQGVLGVAIDGLDKLGASAYGATRALSVNLKLEWIGQVMQIEQGNRHQKEVMNDLAQKWIDGGCRVMVMKGQANAIMYPHHEHRSPGDIDCYLFEDYAKGNDIAREAGSNVDEGWYKHSVVSYKGETFENHQYFVHTREGKRSKLLQQELEVALKTDNWECFPDSGVLIPPVQWNAMFLTYHACAHFLSEGLRLKQVLDWAMFLKCHQEDVDWKAYFDFCERHHLRRFADALTAICEKYLGIKIINTTITKDDTYTKKIISSIFNDDDYIYSEGESGWKERWHVVRNLFRYRWKYEEIYQQSVWKQLWWYASGYIFKTE